MAFSFAILTTTPPHNHLSSPILLTYPNSSQKSGLIKNPSLQLIRIEDPLSQLVGIEDPLNRFAPINYSTHQQEEEASLGNSDCDVNSIYEVLQECIEKKDELGGSRLHGIIVEYGLDSHAFFGAHLIRLFTSFFCLPKAKQAFRKIYAPNVHVWRAIINSHSTLGQHEEAISLWFHLLEQLEDRQGSSTTMLNEHVLVAALESCASSGNLSDGWTIHAKALECGLESYVFVANTLIHMYAKSGSMHHASVMFDRMNGAPKGDVVAWNALLSGYNRSGQGEQVLRIFGHMLDQEMVHINPTQATFVSVLKACSMIEDAETGNAIHMYAIECGFEWDVHIESTLLDMYGKCGLLDDAKAVFERMPKRTVATWNAFIAANVREGHGQEALTLLSRMEKEHQEPNEVTFACILKACWSVAALGHGKQIHVEIVQRGFESNLFICSALIEMYAICGSLEDACMVFHRMPNKDSVVWTSMVSGYALDGNHDMAFRCFSHMKQVGTQPNGITFLCLLSAYGRLGLVQEGCQVFKEMREEHGIFMTIDHMNSMVGLFGRAGLFNEAEDLLECIPYMSNHVGWRSLLGSCKKQKDVSVGFRCFNWLVAMDCDHGAAYMLMSSIYASVGMRNEAVRIERMRRCVNASKKAGKAFIEVDMIVHAFGVADNWHPQSELIFSKLKELNLKMKQEGYRPQVELMLDPQLISESDKEDVLCGHCERMALAFGLLSTPSGTSIRILKNLRMCPDCHGATKCISKMEAREIFIKDTYCLHHFQGGECSCKD